MSKNIEDLMKDSKVEMSKAMDHFRDETNKIRTGKASPSMLSGIMVDYYGTPTPLSQVANVGVADSKTLSIQPWEKSLLGAIEQAIFAANLGLTPMNDGEFVRIVIPAMTESRRLDLVKQVKALGEDAKVSIRQTRHKAMDFIKKEVKDGYPEDAGKKREKAMEDMVHDYYDKVEKLIEEKEKDILTV